MPDRDFRLLLIGYFEGLDAERAIAWRAADSFGLRDFLGLVLPEAPPDEQRVERLADLGQLAGDLVEAGSLARDTQRFGDRAAGGHVPSWSALTTRPASAEAAAVGIVVRVRLTESFRASRRSCAPRGGIIRSMKYKIALRQTDEGYSVSVLGLPGCWSQGQTEEEALENIQAAIREYLAARDDLLKDATVREVDVAS